MLKILVTPLNLMLAGAVVLGLSQLTEDKSGVTVKGTTVKLDNQVSKASTAPIVEALDDLEKGGAKGILLHVTSPGGAVFAGREVNEEMRSSKAQVNTLVTNYAMSMGMDFLLMGKERFATPDAIGMIHRGSANGVSYNELKKKLAMTVPGSPEHEELASNVEAMDVMFDATFTRLEEIKKTSNNPEDMAMLIEDLKVGSRDIFLTAEHMLDLGIVTRIVNSVEEAEELTAHPEKTSVNAGS